jgi:hypothetical protein
MYHRTRREVYQQILASYSLSNSYATIWLNTKIIVHLPFNIFYNISDNRLLLSTFDISLE